MRGIDTSICTRCLTEIPTTEFLANDFLCDICAATPDPEHWKPAMERGRCLEQAAFRSEKKS